VIQIRDFSKVENLSKIEKYLKFKDDVIERFKILDKKFDYIKSLNLKEIPKETQEFFIDDFNLSNFDLIKQMEGLFDIIDFGPNFDFDKYFPSGPKEITKIFVDFIHCVDYAIFEGLILLKENLKSSDKHFSINELKEIALRILSESNFDNMEENKIDLHRIDVKHMGKA
jgi:hypothetical protein